MQTWQLAIRVRRKACEFRLFNLRERHSAVVEERKRHPEMGPSWCKKDDVLAHLKREINRELDEIRFVRMMSRTGPIVGNKMVLHMSSNGTHRIKPGPSIIDLIERESNLYRSCEKDINSEFSRVMADGLDLALKIINNPYRFLNDDEKAAYKRAEDAEDDIVEERAGGKPTTARSVPVATKGPSLAQIKAARRAATDPTIPERGKRVVK